MHPSLAQKHQEDQKQKVLKLLRTGPKLSTDVGRVLSLGTERTREVLAKLKKQGVVGFVTMLGDRRVWCLAHEAEQLQREQRALIKHRREQYQLNRTAKRRGLRGLVVYADKMDHDDWPVQQSRVTEWAPIRPPVPVSVFTLGAAA